jgi:hypothetical protein
MQKLSKRTRVSVLYRENCGGILRNLASGFRPTMSSVADFDLYDDLRERLFAKDAIHEGEIKDQAA